MTRRVAKNAGELEEMFEADLTAVEEFIAAGRFDDARMLLCRVEVNCREIVRRKGAQAFDQLKRIGAAYWQLGYSAMAGQYWYWLDDTRPEVKEAKKEFERSRGDNPALLFEELSEVRYTLSERPGVLETLELWSDESRDLWIDARGSRWREWTVLLLWVSVAVLGLCTLALGVGTIVRLFSAK